MGYLEDMMYVGVQTDMHSSLSRSARALRRQNSLGCLTADYLPKKEKAFRCFHRPPRLKHHVCLQVRRTEGVPGYFSEGRNHLKTLGRLNGSRDVGHYSSEF